MGGELHEFNGEHEHVHLMVSCLPKISIEVLVGKLKEKSSCFLRKEYWLQLRPKIVGQALMES